MKTKINRLFAFILLVCFSVFVVPTEFVHAFYGHEDTHHGLAFPKGKRVIDERHVHCDFLTYDAPHYTAATSANCQITVEIQPLLFIDRSIQVAQLPSERSSLRGPPQI